MQTRRTIASAISAVPSKSLGQLRLRGKGYKFHMPRRGALTVKSQRGVDTGRWEGLWSLFAANPKVSDPHPYPNLYVSPSRWHAALHGRPSLHGGMAVQVQHKPHGTEVPVQVLAIFLNTPVFPGTQSEFRLRVPFRSLHPMSLHGVFVFPSDDLFCVCVSTDPSLGLCLESQGPH